MAHDEGRDVNDDLLRQYNQELFELRELGKEFAARHGSQAERLGLGPELAPDPHVERLLQAFAFLTARIRRKLDDAFPEISDAMLGTLYPHYLAPIPSMAIVQFGLRRDKAEQLEGSPIPRESPLQSEPIDGESVRYRTCYDTRVYPVEVTAASLGGLPFNAAKLRFRGAEGTLRLRLQCLSPTAHLAQMPGLFPLRFYLKGQDPQVLAIYESILNDAIAVGVGNGVDDAKIQIGPAEWVRPVGFDADHAVLPYPPNSFVGYRLLTEYFAFPKKFLFFEVAPAPEAIAALGNVAEIVFYLSRMPPGLEQQVNRDVFRLGCTPVVNLFEKRAEPIALAGTAGEYRVTADARAEQAYEPYSITSATISSNRGEQREVFPLYAMRRGRGAQSGHRFYHLARRLTHRGGPPGSAPTSDLFLSLVDLEMEPFVNEDWTLDLETLCLNRNLPSRLPFGPGEPRLSLQGVAAVAIECLTKPTATIRSGVGDANRWRLVSHLTLNQLSVAGEELGADALRQILRLYDYADSERTRAAIESIRSVTSKRVVGRCTGAAAVGFARGTEVTVDFDDARFSDNGLFLFASVLERFMGLYCSINSFSTMVARIGTRDRELRRWKPRAGEQIIL